MQLDWLSSLAALASTRGVRVSGLKGLGFKVLGLGFRGLRLLRLGD